MHHLPLLLILPTIFGLAFAGTQSSGEQNIDYDPLVGPDTLPKGPKIVQQHGYNGAPQVAPDAANGDSSNDNDVGGAGVGMINPQIIPSGRGGDSNDDDGQAGQAFGGQNAAGAGQNAADAGDSSNSVPSGGSPSMSGGNPNMAGGSPNTAGGNAAAGAEAGDSSNNGIVYQGLPNAAPAVGGAEIGHGLSQNQALKAADGMPAGAVAGVVVGVIAVAAVGTAVAVVVLRSGSSFMSAA